jgi:hypothetical protein
MARAGLNIHNMVNKSRGEMAYTLVDVDSPVPDAGGRRRGRHRRRASPCARFPRCPRPEILLRREAARPRSPRPTSASDAGSGTTAKPERRGGHLLQHMGIALADAEVARCDVERAQHLRIETGDGSENVNALRYGTVLCLRAALSSHQRSINPSVVASAAYGFAGRPAVCTASMKASPTGSHAPVVGIRTPQGRSRRCAGRQSSLPATAAQSVAAPLPGRIAPSPDR